MTKSELILGIEKLNPNLCHRHAERIAATIFDEIAAALARGYRVELRGFGAFSVSRRFLTRLLPSFRRALKHGPNTQPWTSRQGPV
jgi:hypothetical protein